MNMLTSYTLTQTYGHRRTSTHTIIRSSKHIFMPTRTSMGPPHPRIYPHTCILALIFARTPTHTHTHTHTLALTHKHLYVCASAKTYSCIQNKNAFTDTTHNARTRTDVLIR